MPLIPLWAAHLLALLLVVMDAIARAGRLRFLMPGHQSITLWRYVVVNAYGEAASAVTPGRVGGEPARFVAFKRDGVSTAHAATALAAERVIDLSSIAVIGLVLGALFGKESLSALVDSMRQLSSSTIAGFGVGLVALTAVGWIGLRRYRKRLGAGEQGARAPRFELPTAASLVAATMLGGVSIFCRVAILPVLCLALPAAVEWGPTSLGSFALLYSQLLLPTPAGVGGVEAGFALGFSGHLPAARIAALLVTWRVYTLGIGAAVGIVLGVRGLARARSNTLRIALVAAAVSVLPQGLTGQETPLGSRNLPVGHWSYDAISQLRARGLLTGLNPTVQPYRRLEVARALAEISEDDLAAPASHWVELLREELTPELERLDGVASREWGLQFSGGTRASTGARLEPVREVGDADAWPWYRAGGWAESGPLAVESRLLGDYFLEDDPDGLPPGQRRYGRTDNAYLSLTFPVGNVTFGRMQRNWGVFESDGLLLSSVPTAYPQLALELTSGRLTLRSVMGELDAVNGLKRYIAGHRLDYQTDDLVLSFGETILYATENGLALRFLNPMEFLFFDHDNEPKTEEQNLSLNWQLWWRPGPVTISAELMLDDLDVIPGARDPEPTLYATRLSIAETSLLPTIDASLQYERVSAFAYRTPLVVDGYTFLGRGLGPNFSDYDLLTASIDVHPPVRGLRLTPTFQLLRQGEGDFRDPVPPSPEYLASPTIFLGTTERTMRLGLRARYQPNRYVWAAFDIGRNFVDDAGNVTGMELDEFAGTFEVGATIDLPRR